MKVTKVYEEDGCILVRVEGWPEDLILENHVDNRRFLREFNKFRSTNLDIGCTVRELKAIGFREKDWNGFKYLEKNCSMVLKRRGTIMWEQRANGKQWTLLDCNPIVSGLHEDLTKDTICLLNKTSYDKNPEFDYDKSYSGICRAIIEKPMGHDGKLIDEYLLSNVQYTVFVDSDCEMSQIVAKDYADILNGKE